MPGVRLDGAGMRAVLLGRVSTEDKTQDPQVQVAALQAAADRLGWPVVRVVVKQQSAWSSKSAREVQEAVLKACDEEGAQVVMVEALDRIARGKPLATMRFITEELEGHHGIRFWSRREPFLSTSAGPTRDLLLPLFAWIAEQESGQKSERGKQKAQFKRQAAEKLGQRATWGRGAMATDADRRRVHDLRNAAPPLTVRAIAQALELSVGSVSRILAQPRPAEATA